jgi:hypothetical protein
MMAVAVLALVGCGSDDDTSSTAPAVDSSPATTGAATTAPTTVAISAETTVSAGTEAVSSLPDTLPGGEGEATDDIDLDDTEPGEDLPEGPTTPREVAADIVSGYEFLFQEFTDQERTCVTDAVVEQFGDARLTELNSDDTTEEEDGKIARIIAGCIDETKFALGVGRLLAFDGDPTDEQALCLGKAFVDEFGLEIFSQTDLTDEQLARAQALAQQCGLDPNVVLQS